MPSDAYMLLSLANTKLRDYYCSPQDMCEDLGWDEEELCLPPRRRGLPSTTARATPTLQNSFSACSAAG